MRRLRAERLLPIACAGGCAMLGASEFMTTFELNGAPGQTFELQKASEQPPYAWLVLAVFALVALVIAVAGGSRPAAVAVAAAGVIALLMFLLIDLPDAGKVGTLDDPRQSFFNAKADPALGFWLELAGALILAVCGAALATLGPDQLRAFGGGSREPPLASAVRPKPAGSNPGEKAEEPRTERAPKPSRSGDTA